MKFVDTLRLSARSHIYNFGNSILAFVSMTLLSVLVMTIANFCVYYQKSADANILMTVNQDGAYVGIGRLNTSYQGIDKKSIDDFIELADSNNIYDYCNIREMDENPFSYLNDQSVELKPFIGRFKPRDTRIFIDGEGWTRADEGTDNIWVGKSLAESLGLTIGDKVHLKRGNNSAIECTVGGITDYFTYIDIRYIGVSSMTVGMQTSNYASIKEVNALKKTVLAFEKAHSNISLNTNTINHISESYTFVYGLCAVLLIFSAGVCIVCVLNTLKISIENNNATMGMLKALGAKNSNLKGYILLQIGMLVIIGTVLATTIASLIGYFAIKMPISMIMNMAFTDLVTVKSVAGFNYLIPVINMLLIGGVVSVSAIPMLRRYVTADAIKIINEGNI